MLIKGDFVTVYSENGKGVACVLVDVNSASQKIWVRFPTNQVLMMPLDTRRNLYVGQLAGLEFTVKNS